ncbi:MULTISPECIES: hypothetical protein [unclassified Streptosporangium]|nr:MULTISPECIES: hypothetical protein [unclassified Streptosporangium]
MRAFIGLFGGGRVGAVRRGGVHRVSGSVFIGLSGGGRAGAAPGR